MSTAEHVGDQGGALTEAAEEHLKGAQAKATHTITKITAEVGKLLTEAQQQAHNTTADAEAQADAMVGAARKEADRLVSEANARVGEIEALHERARRESAESMKSTGYRCDALIKAAEEQLAKAQAKAGELVSEANSQAGKVRIAAVKKAELLLKEAEQKKWALVREAEELKEEAIREARHTVEEGRRELEILMRRREDISAEISRVQDVLEALESFEAPPAGKGNGVKEAPAASAAPSDGEPSEAQPRLHIKAVTAVNATQSDGKSSEGGSSYYEDELRRMAGRLGQLRVERGNPSMRVIEARAKQLFGEKAVLPIATQSAAFNAKYVGPDKLMWLVRTLLSWDEYGEECPPPDHRSDQLFEWRAQWVLVTKLRPPRRRRAPATPAPDSPSG
ncbi:cell division septum initiation protein DivIVA [Streptomyces pseudovenezuelae]|uniref:Cell division septum initiation protein DivIVA n=1 Tax=Streptomyces pseudovenezuelae TaxID=67350 RepID=A0ABT6M2H5_9ACTN|nr:cell division septum initiation protein DivIVA [Streptomyces pseudovenezuelae]